MFNLRSKNTGGKFSLLSRLVLLILLVFNLTACGEKKYYYSKETEKRTKLPGKPGKGGGGVSQDKKAVEVTDEFLIDVPSGKVDFVFVVDNSDRASSDRPIPGVHDARSGQNLLSWFKGNLERLVRELGTPNANSVLDYRVQVVSAPAGKVSATFRNTTGTADILKIFSMSTVFRAWGVDSSLFEESEDAGLGINAVAATRAALSHADFADRKFVPLFLTYLIGNGSQGKLESEVEFRKLLLDSQRERFQTRISLVSARAEAPWDERFEGMECNYQVPPMAGLLRTWSHAGPFGDNPPAPDEVPEYQAYDLCRLGLYANGNTFAEKLLADARQFLNGTLSGYILSKVPIRNEILVQTVVRPLTRNQDYTFDANRNHIQILPEARLVRGDRITVTYKSVSGLFKE